MLNMIGVTDLRDASYIVWSPRTGRPHGLPSHTSIRIRVRRRPFVVNEIVGVERSSDGLKRPWRLLQVEEQAQIGLDTGIGEIECTLGDAEVMLDEAKDAAKIQTIVVNVRRRRVSRDDNQRNAESVLIVSLYPRYNLRRFVIVPASPVVPCD